jgi:predicted CXXCH cytochrome family protein
MRAQPRRALIFGSLTILLIVIPSLWLSSPTGATGREEAPPEQTIGVDDCLACHDTPGLQTTLPSGEVLYLSVDSVTYLSSTHGRLGYACVQCHTDITSVPHDPIRAETRRDFALNLYTTCARCHEGMYQSTLDSVHQRELAAGNENAAVCTDCHGAHDIGPPSVPRSKIPRTCRNCHSEIYARYAESVHGEALIGEGNPDVPTCVDCHGVHELAGPSNSPFRLFSPQICAECHADQQLMSRYGISTDVFETYVSDFHGTTVVIFEAIAPGQETNKPVCIDCHGVHDMRQVNDPESRVIKENLLSTCQRCHPDATANFPDSWLSHYRPSPEHAPLVYYVNLFYKVLIPTTIGGLLLFVVVDGSRKILDRRRGRRNE